jgi:hypothetical protein
MSTPVILADRFPPSTCDTPTSTCHVIIARAELRERPQPANALTSLTIFARNAAHVKDLNFSGNE